jgi:uncharacterized membrane protein
LDVGVTQTVLVLATVSAGLAAGLFAAFGYAVSPGLRRVDDEAFVQTVRAVNAAILNPVFGLLFGGGLVAAGLAAALAWSTDARGWVLAGALLQAATVAVTMVANVPRNEALATGEGPASALRAAYEPGWNAWNLVRTATGVGATCCLLLACLRL